MTLCEKILLGAGISLAAMQSYAATGWQTPANIKSIYVEAGGAGYSFYTLSTTVGDCGAVGKFHVKSSQAGSGEMYAMVLAAYSAGKRVTFFVDQSQGCAYSGMISTGAGVLD